VLWTGEQPIPGAPEAVSALVRAGKRVLVMTNNATKPLDGWVEKTAKLGFKGLSPFIKSLVADICPCFQAWGEKTSFRRQLSVLTNSRRCRTGSRPPTLRRRTIRTILVLFWLGFGRRTKIKKYKVKGFLK
jgi:hypothetical protein